MNHTPRSKTQPSVLFLQSQCRSDERAEAEKPSRKKLIWALKTGRYLEGQREHERVLQKTGIEERPGGGSTGQQPGDQSG